MTLEKNGDAYSETQPMTIFTKKFFRKKKPKKEKIRPHSSFFKGAAVASLIVMLAYAGFKGSRMGLGIGTYLEVPILIAIGSLVIVILALIHSLFVTVGRALPKMFKGNIASGIGTIFKALPRPSSGVIFGSVVLFISLQHSGFQNSFFTAFLTGPFIIIAHVVLGGCIGFIVGKNLIKTRLIKKALLFALILGIICFDLYIVLWLSSAGSNDYLIDKEMFFSKQAEPPAAPDPSLQGPFKVKTLTYGSGKDKNREEYGAKVAIKTNPVDVTVILRGYKGFKARVREWFWGFGAKEFPVNGRVWYPEGDGPFPLVLIVHGNHNMNEYSDPGYAYLGGLLASRGFIVVSVDENFFNGGFMGLPRKGSENAARGWMLLQHLKTWQKINEVRESIFFNKIDMNSIALIGHSRGGEAVAHAAAQNRLPRFPDDANLELNYNFGIKTIIAIAPSDGQYMPSGKSLPLENVNYLVLQGGHDSDVSAFVGMKQYQRVGFTDNTYRCKSALYIHRANHGQFNTIWGGKDHSPPLSWFLNIKPLLKPEEQVKISKLFISAFLEATINGKREYLQIFRNHRSAHEWLPETIYINRFQDSTFKKIADFEEDINPVSTSIENGEINSRNLSVWKEEQLAFRGGWGQKNTVVKLGWRNDDESNDSAPASYTITLPDRFGRKHRLSRSDILTFSIADTGQKPPKTEENDEKTQKNNKKKTKITPSEQKNDKNKPKDFTLELTFTNGKRTSLPLSRFAPLHPPLKSRFTIWPQLESSIGKNSTEMVLETYEFKLADFLRTQSRAKPHDIEKISFIFNLSPEGMVILDDIGFRKNVK